MRSRPMQEQRLYSSARHEYAVQWLTNRVDVRRNGVLCDAVVDHLLGDRSLVLTH